MSNMGWENLNFVQQSILKREYLRDNVSEQNKRQIITNYLRDWNMMKFQSLILNFLITSVHIR
jgi:hypothetical protein